MGVVRCFGSCPIYKKDSRERFLFKDIEGIEGIAMVNNKLKILDEGEIKFVPECIEMKKPEYVYKFEGEIMKMNICHLRKQLAGETLQDKIKKFPPHACVREENSYNELCNEWNSNFEENEFLKKFLFCDSVESRCEFNQIAKYYKIIPFTPSVMINISPNWSVDCNARRIQKLKELINSYMSEGWYDKWSYVIECGSEGTHIHAHIVAHMNVTRIKSCESHIRKGNHTRQLQKWARKIEGMGGTIEGVSVQKIILRNETLVSDKLDYLIEEKKPEGHKNHHVIQNGYVSGEL